MSAAHPHRRLFLRHASAALAAASVAAPMAARATQMASAAGRSLALDHTHTRERLDLVYAVRDAYVPQALDTLNHFLRDHYTGDVGVMDPQLFDILHRLQAEVKVGNDASVRVLERCGFTEYGLARDYLRLGGDWADCRLFQLVDPHWQPGTEPA